MGEGSTGRCGALLDGNALRRDGILCTIFSLSGSDSVALRDLSGIAEATRQAGRDERLLPKKHKLWRNTDKRRFHTRVLFPV